MGGERFAPGLVISVSCDEIKFDEDGNEILDDSSTVSSLIILVK